MVDAKRSFDELVAARLPGLSPAEAKVARLFRDRSEEVLLASVASLAASAGTSDATVIRAARTLGFDGMEGLRRHIADEMRRRLSQADRLTATLGEVGGVLDDALRLTLDVHAESLSSLRRDLSPDLYADAVAFVAEAPHVVAFGIGPSSCVAEYLALQLRRFGLRASTLTGTGLLAADDLCRLRDGDRLVVLAYGQPYPEVAALLDEAERLDLRRLLITDTLVPSLRGRVDLVLQVARGRAGRLSLHTTTLALVEAILVGVATSRPSETLASLDHLNALRGRLTGSRMDLPRVDDVRGRRASRETDAAVTRSIESPQTMRRAEEDAQAIAAHPAILPSTATIPGGTRHAARRRSDVKPISKSVDQRIPPVQTGE